MECTVGTWLRWMWSCGVRDFGKRSRGWMVREKALDDRLRGLTLIPKATRSQSRSRAGAIVKAAQTPARDKASGLPTA